MVGKSLSEGFIAAAPPRRFDQLYQIGPNTQIHRWPGSWWITRGGETMRGYLITHQDCLDGATAALVGLACDLQPHFVEPDRALVALSSLAAGDPALPIYLADVSLEAEVFSDWKARISAILDHHATALSLAGQDNVTVDLGRAGSHLFYDYAVASGWLTPSPAWDRLVGMVERYDLWQPRHEFGQDLERLFRHFGFSWYHQRFAHGWVPYQALEADQLALLIEQEAHFLRRNLARIHHVSTGSLDLAGLFMDEEGSVNEMSHRLLEKGYALVMAARPDGRLSVRTDHRIDASELMSALFKGGGHRRAAGGRRPQEISSSEDGIDPLLARITHHLQRI